MVSYVNKLDSKIIRTHDLDIIKLASKKKDEENSWHSATSLVISAAITAYGRIHITKLKLEILRLGGNIYYSDTDSIVTDIKLSDNLISKELGKLKLEHEIDKGIFISGKIYCFYNKNGEFVSKAKGVDSKSLSFQDYLRLLHDEKINVTKTQSTKDWVRGYVTIDNKIVTLSGNSYKRREKIYHNSRWVDTKPLVQDIHSKDFILVSFDFILVDYKSPEFKPMFESQLETKALILNTKALIIYPKKSLVKYKGPLS